jgi:hypothetical protein
LRRHQLDRQAIETQAERGSSVRGDQLFARRIRPQQLNDGQPLRRGRLLELAHDPVHELLLRRRQLGFRFGALKWHEKRRQTIIEIIHSFEITDDALIGAQRTHGQRLAAGLIDLE